MRLVLDTNTAVSGLLWHGTPGKLIDAAQNGDVFLFTSVALLTELQGVLTRSKFAKQLQTSGLNVRDVFDGYAALATVVIPAAIAATILRDSGHTDHVHGGSMKQIPTSLPDSAVPNR